jgi:putative transferase (TIGR04331 family)
MRQRIKLTNITNNGFESILQRCIPLQIPKVYIEGYSTMAQRVLEIYPKKTKIIITSNAHKVNEGFKFWAATQVDKGVKLVITQHGGHVGDALWSMDDDHEIAIADRYFTWGWDRNNEKKTVPVPSSMLGGIKKNCAPNQTGPILCVTSSYLRYPYQMFAVPDGPMSLDTQMLQENFLGKISSEVSKILVFRLFKDQGWEESLRWQDSDVCPQIYKGEMSYHSHLSLSRLCICFYNGTPFLETFSANYPTLICWDPRCSELNELAQPYFG